MEKLVSFVQQEVSGIKSLKCVNFVLLGIMLIQEPKHVDNALNNIQYLEMVVVLNALMISIMIFITTSVFNV